VESDFLVVSISFFYFSTLSNVVVCNFTDCPKFRSLSNSLLIR